MSISGVSAGIGIMFFASTLNKTLLTITSFWYNTCLIFFEVFINISFMNLGKDNGKRNISLAFGFQSVGNFLGPLLLGLFGIKSFGYLGLSILLVSIFFYKIPSFYSEAEQDNK